MPNSIVANPRPTSSTISAAQTMTAGRSRMVTRKLVRIAVLASALRSRIIGIDTTEIANTIADSMLQAPR